MLYRIKDAIFRAKLFISCRTIFKTSPVTLYADSNLAIASSVSHKHILMYLLAIKSLLRQLKAKRVFILNDGTLLKTDIETLNIHIPGLVILSRKEFKRPNSPHYISWNLLVMAARLVKEYDVLFLDSDTLTIGPITEVIEYAQKTTPFVLTDGRTIESMVQACERAKKIDSLHVQTVAEKNFDKLTQYSMQKYIRGCAGFVMFPKGSFSEENISEISEKISAAIGKKWGEWGTAQVTSNIIIANIPNVKVLPFPKYCAANYWNKTETVFVHFIGYARFRNNLYSRLGKKVIKELSESPPKNY